MYLLIWSTSYLVLKQYSITGAGTGTKKITRPMACSAALMPPLALVAYNFREQLVCLLSISKHLLCRTVYAEHVLDLLMAQTLTAR
jgi:hypothetical protein